MKYNVTITRTGGIVVDAENPEDALQKVSDMSITEIEEHAQLTGWEASDADLLCTDADSVRGVLYV